MTVADSIDAQAQFEETTRRISVAITGNATGFHEQIEKVVASLDRCNITVRRFHAEFVRAERRAERRRARENRRRRQQAGNRRRMK